jgi:transcriptional regulator with PAS, ATPase and Fis domain
MYEAQEDVIIAWKAFVKDGVILEDKVRPEIGRAWLRCSESGIDPWSSTYPKGSMQELKERIEQNQFLLDVASPVMEILYTLLNINISICDKDGFIFKLISPLDNYPRSLGSFIRESTHGNGALTITLKENIPSRIDGFEHYRAVSHGCSDASAPIMHKGELIGAINGVSIFGPMPDVTLDMLVKSAALIEQLLSPEAFRQAKYSDNMQSEMGNAITEILNLSDDVVMILSDEGYLKYSTSNAKDSVGMIYNGVNIVDMLDNKKDAKHILEGCALENTETTYKFQNSKNMKLLRKSCICFGDETYKMLVFKHIQEKQVVHIKEIHRNDLYIGNSEEWCKVDEMIHRVAGFSSNVMVFGETGTGKEVVSKAIHKLSGRKGNFVAVNCGNIPKELLCSEFFGYERGAFTGARAEGAMGKFEYANNGTLLLDEISEMPLDMQVSLLRFIQERSITKINSNVTKELDVRIIAATNKNICDLVSQGLFREDLYYRLAVIELELPPLNERGEDVILLAEHFIRELSSQLNIGVKTLDRCAKDVLLSHYWPGNIRELRNYIEKIMILSLDDVITADILARYGMIHEGELHPQTVKGKNDKLDSIRRCLEKHKGNIAQTAKELGMARNTLYRKIDKYNIHIQTSVVKHAN